MIGIVLVEGARLNRLRTTGFCHPGGPGVPWQCPPAKSKSMPGMNPRPTLKPSFNSARWKPATPWAGRQDWAFGGEKSTEHAAL